MAKILIVDDNIMNCKMAVRILEPLRMQIDTAENGKVALDKIQADSYDIVLMDHMMPVMDGVEAVRALRNLENGRYGDLPVIALSASTEPETEALFAAAGMNDFVAKPIDGKRLCEVLQKWLPQEQILWQEQDNGTVMFPEQLPIIDGIDVLEGIRNSGGIESLISLFGIFYQLIDTKSQKIVQCLRDKLIRDYTIEVHGLKNTARMIGALELSREFAYLEQMGSANDREGIERETPPVLEHYRSYKISLAPYGTPVNEAVEEVPGEELILYLQGIIDAIAGFDLDCADAALVQLIKCRIPAECQCLLERLKVAVADVDMDNIGNIAREMIAILENLRR